MSKDDDLFARAVYCAEFRQLFDQVAIFTKQFVFLDFCNPQGIISANDPLSIAIVERNSLNLCVVTSFKERFLN